MLILILIPILKKYIITTSNDPGVGASSSAVCQNPMYAAARAATNIYK